MPVSTRAIWLPVAIVGIGLFLTDVAVRRVRLDVVKAYYAMRRGLQHSKQQTGMQIEGLQAARAQAQERMAGAATASQDSDITRGTGQAAPVPQQTAKRKFEASEEQVRAGKSKKVALGGEAETPEQAKRRKAQSTPPAGEEEQGMSRLLKAKQRVRDEMKDD